MPGGALGSESRHPSEGSEPVRKKSQLDIGTMPGDDVHKPQLDIDIGTREFSIPLSKLLIYRSYSNTVCDVSIFIIQLIFLQQYFPIPVPCNIT